MNLYDNGADLREQMQAFHAGTDTHAYRWLGCHYAGDNGYVFRALNETSPTAHHGIAN